MARLAPNHLLALSAFACLASNHLNSNSGGFLSRKEERKRHHAKIRKNTLKLEQRRG